MTSPPTEPTRHRTIGSDHCAAIGEAIITWNEFEFTIDRALWKLVNREQAIVACLTGQYNSIFPRLKAVIALLTLYEFEEQDLRILREIQGSLSSLNEQRNRIVHDPRFQRIDEYDNKDIVRYQVTVARALMFGSQIETLVSLEAFRDSVNALRSKFVNVLTPIFEKLRTSPSILEKRFPRITLNDLA